MNALSLSFILSKRAIWSHRRSRQSSVSSLARSHQWFALKFTQNWQGEKSVRGKKRFQKHFKMLIVITFDMIKWKLSVSKLHILMHTGKLNLNKLRKTETKQRKFKPLCHLNTTVHSLHFMHLHNAHDIISLKHELFKIQHDIYFSPFFIFHPIPSPLHSPIPRKFCVLKAWGSFAMWGNHTSDAKMLHALNDEVSKCFFDKFFDYAFVCKFDAIHKKQNQQPWNEIFISNLWQHKTRRE